MVQIVPSRYTEFPIPTHLDRQACTKWLHWVHYTHSCGSPRLYPVATLSAFHTLLWIAQLVPSRYTECPALTLLERQACTESLHWVTYTHSFASPGLYRFATLSTLYPLHWMAQHVPGRYTECPTLTHLDSPAHNGSLHWVPYTQTSGSPRQQRVATLSVLYHPTSIAQNVPISLHWMPFTHSSEPHSPYRVAILSDLY